MKITASKDETKMVSRGLLVSGDGTGTRGVCRP